MDIKVKLIFPIFVSCKCVFALEATTIHTSNDIPTYADVRIDLFALGVLCKFSKMNFFDVPEYGLKSGE